MRSVSEWDPASEAPPPELSGTELALIEASMAPATREDAGRELMLTLAAFDPPNGNIKAHTAACLEQLEDVPLDLIRAGLKRVRAECTFTPKAAEIRSRVVAEMNERKRLVIKARVAATMAARRRPSIEARTPLTPEQQRVVDEALAGLPQGVRRFA